MRNGRPVGNRPGAPPLDITTENNLVIAPSVAVTTYLAIVTVSILKPWGRTRHG
jgi:hypothetical protein